MIAEERFVLGKKFVERQQPIREVLLRFARRSWSPDREARGEATVRDHADVSYTALTTRPCPSN